MRSRTLIRRWYEQFAPGLEIQPIPKEANIIGPFEPLIPFGLQYRVVMPDGSEFPRHQSGPGVTIGITDGKRVVLKADFRQESGYTILKCCGGFAGAKRDVAAEIVSIYQSIFPGSTVLVSKENYISLRKFVEALCRREYDKHFALKGRPLIFTDRPINYPNIRICSISGYLRISESEMDILAKSQNVVDTAAASRMQFGDANAQRIVERLACIFS